MDQFGSTSNAALVASLLLLASMLWIRRRQGRSARDGADNQLDTVMAWPTELVRVLTPLQRQAYELLREALPRNLILVQTPLAHFVRVSTRHSYVEWHRRAGRLRASFLVCDHESHVVGAVALRLSNESDRERSRHQRLVRVLESAGVTVMVWTEAGLPNLAQVRSQFAAVLKAQAQSTLAREPKPTGARRNMSGASELTHVESTDFAGLDTAPAPFDARASTERTGRG